MIIAIQIEIIIAKIITEINIVMIEATPGIMILEEVDTIITEEMADNLQIEIERMTDQEETFKKEIQKQMNPKKNNKKSEKNKWKRRRRRIVLGQVQVQKVEIIEEDVKIQKKRIHYQRVEAEAEIKVRKEKDLQKIQTINKII